IRRFAASGSASMSWPQITAVPLVGARKPVIIFIVVDLPAPLGPRNPSTSPSGTLNDTSSTAVNGPNFLTRLRISSMPRRSKSPIGNDHSKQPIAPELGRIAMIRRRQRTRLRRRQHSFDLGRDCTVGRLDLRRPGAGQRAIGADQVFVEIPARRAGLAELGGDPAIERMGGAADHPVFLG